MTVNIERNYESVTLGISGRLDTATAPNLEKIINEFPEDIKEIVFDMFRVDYISSAGIRVLLGAYKKMNANRGIMRIEKANDIVREVFEMTGLLDILEQEKSI